MMLHKYCAFTSVCLFLCIFKCKLIKNFEKNLSCVLLGHRDTPLWWIGLEDKDADGVFAWQDGSPITYLDWGEHQPSEVYSNERCVMMTHTVSSS